MKRAPGDSVERPVRPGRSGIAILTYHSLDDSGSVLSVSPRLFAQHMAILADSGIKVVSLREARDRLKRKFLGKPAAVITFDDGFENIYERGFPVLRRFGFPATVFLVTDYCGRDNGWPGQPSSVARRPLLRWSQVSEMRAAGIVFGSHTATHPDMTRLHAGQLREEIIGSKKRIEDITGSSVDLFAYPYGAYNPGVKQAVKEHYSIACTTDLEFVTAISDPLALERLDVYYLRSPLLFRRLFCKNLSLYLRLRRSIRRLRSQHAFLASVSQRA